MVAKEILKFHIAYEPKIIYFSMPFENPVASTTLANSIVLTPGILTLDVERDGSYQVHALNDALANFMLEGEMCRRVAMLFDEPCQFSAISKDEVGFALKEKG